MGKETKGSKGGEGEGRRKSKGEGLGREIRVQKGEEEGTERN